MRQPQRKRIVHMSHGVSCICAGYFRLALAQKNLGKLDAAVETIKKGLSVDLCKCTYTYTFKYMV